MEMVGGCAGGWCREAGKGGGEGRRKKQADVCVLSLVRLFATPWTVACQAPLSILPAIFQARILEWGVISFSQRKAEELPKKKKEKEKIPKQRLFDAYFF